MKLKIENSKKIEECKEDFLNYCKVKNLSARTIEYYQNNLKKFIEFTSNCDVEEVTKVTVDKYIIYLRSRKTLNSISVNTYIRAVRAFLYYCMGLDYISNFKITITKAEKKVKETYTDAELKLLLEKPNLKRCTFVQYRNWVVINFLIGTGIRLNTLVNIKIKDLDLVNEEVLLRIIKNKKQYIIPLSKSLIPILQEYLKFRKGKDEDFLFCTVNSNKIQTNGIKIAIRNYNRKRGINKTSIHLFRHTFSKNFILAGGDIMRLKSILGHSSLDVVKEYLNMFGSDLKKDFDKFNLLDRLKNTNKESIKMRK